MDSGGRRESPCVIVVEDHLDSCLALVRLLAASGYSVVAAQSMQQAREAVQRHGCDLLISDIGLPDGSGLDLMRELRTDYGLKCGIALTGHTTDEDESACAAAGFSTFLAKPVRFDELERIVKDLLQNPDSCSRFSPRQTAPR